MPYHTAPMNSADSTTTAAIAFIGGGKMAGAMIGGLLAAGHAPANLRAVEVDGARAERLRQSFRISASTDRDAMTQDADAVVIAVKPQQLREALQGLRLKPGCTVISIAAGVRLDSLRQLLGNALHYVRTMPNTPALLGQGITGLYTADLTPAAARQLAETVMRTAGKTVWLEHEADLDAVTALSGSGPAYFFLLTELLCDAGVALGLRPETAAVLAQQTLAGAAAMAAQPGADVAQLRANVTSKGGTTEAALKHFEAADLRKIVQDALQAAQRRGQQLGDDLSAALKAA